MYAPPEPGEHVRPRVRRYPREGDDQVAVLLQVGRGQQAGVAARVLDLRIRGNLNKYSFFKGDGGQNIGKCTQR